MELRPDAAGTATVTTLLSGLTNPQGMAFATARRPMGAVRGRVGPDRPVPVGTQRDRRPSHGDCRWAARPGSRRRRRAPAQGRGGRRRRHGLLQRRQLVQRQPRRPDDDAAARDDHVRPPRRDRPAGGRARGPQRRGPGGGPERPVWTAVNERDNIPYPSHRAYGTYADAFGLDIQAYVNEHPPDEVVPVTAGRDLGWPYCDPGSGRQQPGRLAGRHPAGRQRDHQPDRNRA